ncbi:MAG TPA: phosphoribosylglycinamide formyltransferase [Clostridiales bacterium]|nr:phosphoribosylglycinamide formyltransferase [Clostridiales bacterium]
MKKIAVFVSGGGTNLQNIIDSIERKELNAQIVLVVASKHGIFAIERAKNANIPVSIYEKGEYENLELMYADLIDELKEKEVEYIILAGYLTILTPNIIREYKQKIINIHPSLLPKFGGKGYYGLKVHQAVIDAKEKVSGATVHFVDEQIDTGDIIDQVEVPVYEYDTPETLQARVLQEEHKLYLKALKKVLK